MSGKIAFLPPGPTVITSCGDDGNLISNEEKYSQLRSSIWAENSEGGLNDFAFFGSTIIATTENESFLFIYDFIDTIEANKK